MPLTLNDLLVQMTKDEIYEFALNIATDLGLPVTAWLPGDPTRSLYHIDAELLATLESIVNGYISASFLDYASGDWLKIRAKQTFNVDVPDATFAETTITLTNAGGGVYILAPGDVTFKASSTGATYHNTSGGTLTGVGTTGATLTLNITADVAGSASSAGAGDIDTLVTTLLGVTCTNPTAAVGADAQDDATTRQVCRDKAGSFSPNGPRDAYSYVALTPSLTGTTAITRARAFGDSTTGNVTVYLAGPSGGALSADVTLVSAAITTYATPLCITPTVLSANNVTVPVTYNLWLYKSVNKDATTVQGEVLTALEKLFSTRPIGGDIIPPATSGALYVSLIESTIRALYPQAFRVQITLPSGDVALGNGDVAVLGTVTPSVNFVADP